MLGTWLQRLAAAAPGRCAICGAWPAEPVCGACAARFAVPVPRCTRCALPVPPGTATCGACVREPPPLAHCHAAVRYGYPWSGLVARFKFQAEPGWARVFAALLQRTPGATDAVAGADCLIPLPLAPARLAERGFNQAMELARALAPRKTEPGLLLRLRETAPQASLDRKHRAANMRAAFGVEPLRAAELRGRKVVLVDDVMTSGASLSSAAQALLAAGCASVGAVVVARTDEAA